MTIKTLYKYIRNDGGTTVSTEKPEVDYTELYRIIADEGKSVTQNGTDIYAVIDTDSTEGWYEVDETDYVDPDEISPEELMSMIEEVL